MAAVHISGFEPSEVIKNKIINKIQQKYNIKEENLLSLKNILISEKYYEEDLRILNKRTEDQIKLLKTLANNDQIIQSTNYKDLINSVNNYIIKKEIKRYEKEMEAKAAYNALDNDVSNHLDYNNFNLNQSNKILFANKGSGDISTLMQL